MINAHSHKIRLIPVRTLDNHRAVRSLVHAPTRVLRLAVTAIRHAAFALSAPSHAARPNALRQEDQSYLVDRYLR